MDDEPGSLVLDMNYEWDVGRFGWTERPQFNKFSEFEDMADNVVDKKQKVLMYTALGVSGVRCSAAC